MSASLFCLALRIIKHRFSQFHMCVFTYTAFLTWLYSMQKALGSSIRVEFLENALLWLWILVGWSHLLCLGTLAQNLPAPSTSLACPSVKLSAPTSSVEVGCVSHPLRLVRVNSPRGSSWATAGVKDKLWQAATHGGHSDTETPVPGKGWTWARESPGGCLLWIFKTQEILPWTREALCDISGPVPDTEWGLIKYPNEWPPQAVEPSGYCVDGSRFAAGSIASHPGHQQCLGLIILCWGGPCSAFWDG